MFQLAVTQNASDLHLVVGVPPTLRVNGQLVPVPATAPLRPDEIKSALSSVLTSEQLERLTVNKELDFSLSFSEEYRFRVNAYTQRENLAAAFRLIPSDIPGLDTLGLPATFRSFANLKQGLVLVTGPTGQGKSTTLAALINEINRSRAAHIITIEDPVEFIFKPDRSIISQREMGTDTHSWSVALRSTLREDPDVVLVGEMRDYETVSAALTIAETGHLVLATLHTNSAAQTIDRIVDVFPHEQQDQVKLQLSNVIEAVLSQRLIPTMHNSRVLAYELMLATTAIRTAIRDGKTHQIDSVIQTSSESGMNPLESSLADLVLTGKVSFEEAQAYALRPEQLSRILRR